MEPEGSLLCLEEPATGTYSEPDESSPQLYTLFPQDPLQYYPLIYAWVLVVSSLQVFRPKFCVSHHSLMCKMPRPRPSHLHYTNNIW